MISRVKDAKKKERKTLGGWRTWGAGPIGKVEDELLAADRQLSLGTATEATDGANAGDRDAERARLLTPAVHEEPGQ